MPVRRALADPSLADRPEKRAQLSYLIGCALPRGVEVYTTVSGTEHRFAGQVGLAPAWLDRPPTLGEQRWVSACLLARTNLFGKSVPVSLRARGPSPAFFRTDAQERAAFPLFEGGFFGNLFLPVPIACACTGRHTTAQAADPVWHDRVCTQPSGATLPTGARLSRCRFVLTGGCGQAARFRWNGETYREVIFVYLRPRGR